MISVKKILIFGLPGTGKSLFLSELKKLDQKNYFDEYYDLDAEILKKNNFKNISEFINCRGWQEFRKQEAETFQQYLVSQTSLILSLGGGAFNEKLYQRYSSSEYLWVCLKSNYDSLLKRVKKTGLCSRPWLDKPKDEIFQTWVNRESKYPKSGVLVVENNGPKMEFLHQIQNFYNTL